jgi:acetyltransferase-like isoleucine patch superfamily enzyme
MREPVLGGMRRRVLQLLARNMPGSRSLRVLLHRWRGVRIGRNVWIGYDVILDTSRPYLIELEDDVTLSVRVTVVAHFMETHGVKIKRQAFVGPAAVVLPGVTIGEGAVVTAGSVVTRSVPPMTVVQGNPAAPVARCGVPMLLTTPLREFRKHLKPVKSGRSSREGKKPE